MLKRRTPIKTKTPLNSRSTLKKGNGIKMKNKSQQTINVERVDMEAMWEVFKNVWKKRGPYSEVSKQFLGQECRTIHMHHILPKSKYKALMYEESNIIILSWEEHANVEMDMYRYEEVNRRREELKKKYDL